MSSSNALTRGFTSYSLKVLAVITMTMDHIYHYLAEPLSVPVWFGLIGRLAAPLFLFCVAKGVFYTHDRAAYARRLYIAMVLMAAGNWILNRLWGIPSGIEIENHVFSTLFYVVYFLTALELLRDPNPAERKTSLALGLLALPFLIAVIHAYLPGSWFKTLFDIVLPSPFSVEGGFIWILLGIGIYYTMGNPFSLSLFYTLSCLLFFAADASYGMTWANLFTVNYQWLMIAALPFMLLYNGQRGKSHRWFFYIYYPAHIYLLAVLAWIL